MLVDKNSSTPQIDSTKAKQIHSLEMFLSHICGGCVPLRPAMLNSLLVLVAESDWALSTIPDVDYIKPLEEYCEQTQPCAVPVLNTRGKSDPETCSFLQTHNLPSDSTDNSSELVTFAGRLCTTLAEHVSTIKTLFTESSPKDPSLSAISTTRLEESPLLSESTVLEVLCEGFSLFDLPNMTLDKAFQHILIDSNFVPLIKFTIITCLDLLDHESTDSICPPTYRADLLHNILDSSWSCLTTCLCVDRESLYPVVESAFSDVPQLCSLLERTCRHSSPTDFSHLRLICNVSYALPCLIPRILEENLVHRMINTSKPISIPTIHFKFHLYLIWAVTNLVSDPDGITKDKDERKRIRILQFERVFKPAKQYLEFILHREEFIPKNDSNDPDLSPFITDVLILMIILERELFEDGEIAETGREEWEVWWLVENTDEKSLSERLKKIRNDAVEMKKNEKARWKKRVERQREAGHEDAMEGWLLRRDNETQSEIVQYVRNEGKERGMNGRL
ncbi:hypothetical protein BLNAU_1621 [Blattamonas nauphoetae]|uniref:Uncharacterized protein n=1 Tax=Blattamonas nauphoetae TaxID=2049346 RepID=A0ABQ9YIM1_9EUKA|nr:hypothetical protein BLNAU_1621 [Blattamonas nauphoetae]